MPGLSPRHARLRPGISFCEGIPSRRTPLRFAPFRPLLIPDLTRDLLLSAAFAPEVPCRVDYLHSRQGKRPFRPKSLPRLHPKCHRMAIFCNRGLALARHSRLALPPHPRLDQESLPRHARLRPGISLREGPLLGPSVHFSGQKFARRSTLWTFRSLFPVFFRAKVHALDLQAGDYPR